MKVYEVPMKISFFRQGLTSVKKAEYKEKLICENVEDNSDVK